MSTPTPTIIPLRSAQLGATRLTSLSSTISPHSSTIIPPSRVISCSQLHLAVSDVGIALCYQDKDDATVTESVVGTWPPVKGKKIIDPLNPSTLFNPKKPATAIHGLSIVYQPAAMDVHIGGMVPPHMRIGIEWHDRVDAKIEGTSTKLIHIQAAMETQYLTKLETAIQPYVMKHNVAKLLRRGVSRWATNKYTNPYYTAPIRTLLKITSILIETAFIICLLVELYARMPRVITFFISGFFNWIHATGDHAIQYFISLYMPYHDAHPIFSTLALLIACTMTLPVFMPIIVAFGVCYGLSHFTVQIVLALTAAQHVVTILMQTRKTYKLMVLYANMALRTVMFILKKGKGGGGGEGPRAGKSVSTTPTTNTTSSTTSINSSSTSIASVGTGLKSE